ncbi:uncharacterized protein LOC34622635 [Cyclospora cayetanensis]|uniref:Uncharacterized protein LOC34622635 n=1 Tax=Cyclospora cayetanensis TaxID=88456 RepID=A0A6P6S3F7_9EIME|nr:uncharacterized protein LOC34622635 [Cyclospora cayetanensis]
MTRSTRAVQGHGNTHIPATETPAGAAQASGAAAERKAQSALSAPTGTAWGVAADPPVPLHPSKPSPAAAAASPACASWAEAASEAKRSAASQETNSCTSCSSSFPWDGAPEVGSFRNSQGLYIKVYRWRHEHRQHRQQQQQHGDTAAGHASAQEAPRWGLWGAPLRDRPVRGVVVLVHGLGEHCRSHFFHKPPVVMSEAAAEAATEAATEAAAGERGDGWGAFRPTYIGSWVEGFNRLGFDVVGLDMQGHGASDGWGKGRCIVRSLDDLAEDLLLLLRLLRAEYPQRHPCEEGQLLHAQVHPLQRGGAACRAQPHSLPSSGGGEGSRLQRRRRSPSAVGRSADAPADREAEAPPEKAAGAASAAAAAAAAAAGVPMFLVGLSLGGWVALRAVQLAANERRSSSAAAAAEAAADDFAYGHVFQENLRFVECFSTPEAARAAAAADADAAAQAATAAAVGTPLCLQGLVLLSPMLQLSRRRHLQRSRLIRYAAAALAAVKPHTPLLPPGTRRRHPYLLHYYQSDPLTYKGGLPAGIAVPLMWEMEAATQHSELLQLQHQDAGAALLVHAVQDPLCDITGSVNCFSNLLGLPDRQLLAIEGPLPGAAAPAASTPANCQFDSSDMQRDLEAQHEEGSNGSGSVHEHVHPKLHALYPEFDFHLPAAPASAAAAQQQPACLKAYEERMKGAADCRERKPRVIVARGIDVVHDLPNEPGQHLLFPLVAAWITSRCPEPQDQRIQQRTVHPQEHHQQEESNL